MALRFLAGKLKVPAGAALRRVEGSRGVASRSSQVRDAKEGIAASMEGKVLSAAEEEQLRRMMHENAVLISQLKEALREAPMEQNHSTQLALYLSGGSIIGVFIGSLMLRYDDRSGGKIGKMMRGIPT